MFSRSAQGRFKVCPHKSLAVGDTEASLECPKTTTTKTEVRVQAVFSQDVLNVMTTGGETAYRHPKAAVAELRKAAGALVCGNCLFYKMSRGAVNVELAIQANTNAELLDARANELRAQKNLLDAANELTQAHPGSVEQPATLPPAIAEQQTP